MNSPSMTIQTVHGLKETVIFDNFTVGLVVRNPEKDTKRDASNSETLSNRVPSESESA